MSGELVGTAPPVDSAPGPDLPRRKDCKCRALEKPFCYTSQTPRYLIPQCAPPHRSHVSMAEREMPAALPIDKRWKRDQRLCAKRIFRLPQSAQPIEPTACGDDWIRGQQKSAVFWVVLIRRLIRKPAHPTIGNFRCSQIRLIAGCMRQCYPPLGQKTVNL